MQRVQGLAFHLAESLINFLAWCVCMAFVIAAVLLPLWLTGLV